MSVDLNPAWFGRLDMQHPTDGIASHLHIVDEETFFQTYIQHCLQFSFAGDDGYGVNSP